MDKGGKLSFAIVVCVNKRCHLASSIATCTGWICPKAAMTVALVALLISSLTSGGGFNSEDTLDFPGSNTAAPPDPGDSFPAGTRLLFQQASPPTGWTVSSAYDNRALRIASGGGGSDSGSSFTATFAPRNVPVTTTVNGGIASHTLSLNEIPNHSHSANYRLGVEGSGNVGGGTNFKGNLSGSTGNAGGNSGHSHGHSISVTASASVDMTVRYANACIGIKN